ncbi:MAG: hypothetical protein KBD23_02880 [Gammaproteobacteria bacterium]|nr:hypothetical protein [Gammaproteobacteria bacterium]MBP9729069.1 hypothetical protein [Gammaproteobacteria bacterium]
MLKGKAIKRLRISMGTLLFLALMVAVFLKLSPDNKLFMYKRYSSPKYNLYAKYSQIFLGQPMPASYISKKNLDDKLAHPAAWIPIQINNDFSNYHDVSKQNVIATYNDLPAGDWVILFQIEKGQLTVTQKKDTVLNGSATQGLKMYSNIFRYIAKQGYVNDLSFLLRLSDFMHNASERQVAMSAPILTTAKDLSKTKEKKFILIPDYMSLEDITKIADRVLFANTVFPWQSKEDKVLWRGGYADVSGFRAKVVAFGEKHPEFVDAKFVVEQKDFLSPEMQVRAKCLLSIDGHTAAWTRPIWQLFSNSVMLKQDSPMTQWYYAALQPGVDYIPVSNDVNQLEASVKAYTDTQLEAIAIHGSDFAKNNLTFDDMMAYIVQVLQTYERLQANQGG